jgi:hypothetical protein
MTHEPDFCARPLVRAPPRPLQSTSPWSRPTRTSLRPGVARRGCCSGARSWCAAHLHRHGDQQLPQPGERDGFAVTAIEVLVDAGDAGGGQSGRTDSDVLSYMPSDLVGWAGFQPATSASRTGLRPCYQVFWRSTGHHLACTGTDLAPPTAEKMAAGHGLSLGLRSVLGSYQVRVDVVPGAAARRLLGRGPARRRGPDVALDELAHGDPTRRRGAADGHLDDELGQLSASAC